MDDAGRRRLLHEARTVAVVGLSEKPERESYAVAQYLQAQGYRIVPVNPAQGEILGERSYASLSAIPADVTVDIVDVFRKGDAVPGIVAEALGRVPRPRTVWLQLTVTSPEGKAQAEAAGLPLLEDLCIRAEHRRLVGERTP